MPRINKSAEVLKIIAGKRVIVEQELVSARSLISLFGSAPRRRIIDTAALLSKQGFISVGSIDDEKIYKITDKGNHHLELYILSINGIPKSATWNKTWYITTFEIADSKKVSRNYLISQLKLQGFYNYTKGIWIYPYDPTNYLKQLGKLLDLGREIKQITAVRLDDEQTIKKHFGLE